MKNPIQSNLSNSVTNLLTLFCLWLACATSVFALAPDKIRYFSASVNITSSSTGSGLGWQFVDYMLDGSASIPLGGMAYTRVDSQTGEIESWSQGGRWSSRNKTTLKFTSETSGRWSSEYSQGPIFTTEEGEFTIYYWEPTYYNHADHDQLMALAYYYYELLTSMNSHYLAAYYFNVYEGYALYTLYQGYDQSMALYKYYESAGRALFYYYLGANDEPMAYYSVYEGYALAHYLWYSNLNDPTAAYQYYVYFYEIALSYL